MKVDDYFADLLVKDTNIFKNINPNAITLLSYALNIVIIYILSQPTLNVYLLAITFVFRFLTDILDGAVARKYNKVSVIGGILDTFGDVMFILIFTWYLLYKLKGPMHIFPVIMFIMGAYIYNEGTLHDHSALKDTDGHFIQQCVAHCVNNTWCVFSVFFAIILYIH